MSTISLTLPVDGSTADVADINTPLTTIKNVINGNLDNANISASAAIAASKISGLNPSNFSNPYKFSAYRNAAYTTAGVVIPFDTELFDTNNNFDITTNKGRYTAPIAGFYWFSAQLAFQSSSSGHGVGAALTKNGSTILAGSTHVVMYGSAGNDYCGVAGILQLAANDYIEVIDNYGALWPLSVGSSSTYFQGFLVSAT